ncbi:MAG: MBL fold metallo-hydrolase [Candidatus Aenigmatarchaeota archaeon]
MKLEFLGALNCIGASAVHVNTEKISLLLDYGAKTRERPPKPPLPIKGKVDFTFLTHAHLDHSGFLPTITKKFNSFVYCTDITMDLTELLLLDSIKISKEENFELPFNKKDITELKRKTVFIEYDTEYYFDNVMVKFLDACHIPGSSQILIEFKNKKILYTGDFNTIETRLIKAKKVKVENLNALIIESTYHDREHEKREKEEKRLVEIVEKTVENGGICLIPAFAVGRAQEVFSILTKEKVQCPIYIDGMAKRATIIINKYKKYLKEKDIIDKALKSIEFVNKNKRKKVLKEKSCVIICGSGFLDGGMSEFYFKKIKDDEKNSVVFVGYQVKDSKGRKVLEEKKYENEKVKAFVEKVDLSAHAGRKELLEFIKDNNPEKVFCVHGENIDSFVKELNEMGFDAINPLEEKVYSI